MAVSAALAAGKGPGASNLTGAIGGIIGRKRKRGSRQRLGDLEERVSTLEGEEGEDGAGEATDNAVGGIGGTMVGAAPDAAAEPTAPVGAIAGAAGMSRAEAAVKNAQETVMDGGFSPNAVSAMKGMFSGSVGSLHSQLGGLFSNN